MAQQSVSDIEINGHVIKHFSSFTLSQSIFDHHTFKLVCPAEAIDELSGHILQTSKNLVGGLFTLQLHPADVMGTLQFSGVVTQVEAARHSRHNGDIIISGQSPTILLDGNAHCKSWEKKTLKKIIQEVLREFPNMLQTDIEPANNETLSYTVQYKETAWQFLKRLSSFHGEWLLYNGRKLCLGVPNGSIEQLIFGYNLESFDVALRVRPTAFQMVAYDYINSEVYNGGPHDIAGKAGLNDWGKHTLEKSEQFYGVQPKQWHNHFVVNKKQLDDFVNTRAAMQSSDMVEFKGRSIHAGLVIGGSVNVKSKNVVSGTTEDFGDYRITAINHYCDGLGNYSNDFVAIPASVNHPPVGATPPPHCETQSAFVTDNHDPKGLARIRVRFHWMNNDEKSPWLRITTPHAGGGKGMFMMPEIGEEVIVGFEGDSATRPYVIGAVYHGKAKSDFANSGNDVKAWQSRSGNKVVMNDKDGSVIVQDKDGNSILLDGSGNITLKSNKTIIIEADDEITLKSKKISVVAEEEVDLTSKVFDAQLSSEAKVYGKNLAEVTSDNRVELSSQNEVGISGKTRATVTALQTQVSGSVQTTVQGAMIKLNC